MLLSTSDSDRLLVRPPAAREMSEEAQLTAGQQVRLPGDQHPAAPQTHFFWGRGRPSNACAAPVTAVGSRRGCPFYAALMG